MLPKISVVLPVFNGQDYLQQCVTSVLTQTFTEFELLIGDDCSTDDSPKIIENFSDRRLRFFTRQNNLGLFGNLNQLARATRSELVHILCQDDLLEINCLEEEVNFFSSYPQIGMSFCKTYRINRRGDVLSKCVLNDMPTVLDPSLSLQCFFYFGCIPGNLSTVCVRRRCFEELGFFDESFQVSADYEMWVRICKQKRLGVIHKHLIRLRSHPKQLSRAAVSGVQYVFENKRIRLFIYPILPKKIKFWAAIYIKLRHNVLDTHYSIRCLFNGRIKDFFKIIQSMGYVDFTLGIICWLLTLNNHLYKPQAKFV